MKTMFIIGLLLFSMACSSRLPKPSHSEVQDTVDALNHKLPSGSCAHWIVRDTINGSAAELDSSACEQKILLESEKVGL
jgi:hypothetical protein